MKKYESNPGEKKDAIGYAVDLDENRSVELSRFIEEAPEGRGQYRLHVTGPNGEASIGFSIEAMYTITAMFMEIEEEFQTRYKS